MRRFTLSTFTLLTASIGGSSTLLAQESDTDQNETPSYVTQEELDEILAEFDATFDDFDSQLTTVDSFRPGTRNFLLTGFATVTYGDSATGSSAFNGGFSPIFLWKIRDDILIEAELEASLGEGDIGAEYIQLLYVMNDFMTVGVGKFLSPLGQFTERYHPSWINKLPTAPLYAGHDGIIPGALVGAQVRGGVRTGSSQWKYTVFVANGPQESGHAGDPGDPEFAFEADGVDVSQNKAIGGRIAFLPTHWIEIGASGYSGKPSEPTGENAGDLSLYMFDLAAHDETPIGYLRFDVEAVTASFDTGASETWSGGYAQTALRPNWGEAGQSNFEGVVRYDWLSYPTGVPSALEPSRWTVGLNYWLDESSVIKLAVESLDVDGETQNSLILQAAVGF